MIEADSVLSTPRTDSSAGVFLPVSPFCPLPVVGAAADDPATN